jgi:ABC-type lipoprotein export system ATPase subunit/GNAT superfamily N-acetyltransferase
MILEIHELSKEFANKDKQVNAVDKASFRVKSGEFAGIIGHSGSGKSTLFHLITGLLRPTSGSISIDELNVNTAGEPELALMRNQKIGYIFQEQCLLKNYTVLENVFMPGILCTGKSKEGIREKAEKLLELVGLSELKNSYPNEISGGEARRVAIARALINDPEIVIADEPTGSLDPDNSDIIMKLLRKVTDQGVAVIISTHDLSVLKYADKVFIMKNGNLSEKGSVVIRTASFEEAQELAEIELACFLPEEAATLEQIKSRLRAFPYHFQVAYLNHKIIGFVDGPVTDDDKISDRMYADVNVHKEEGSYQTVFGLNVLPEFRQKGFAHRLMHHLIKQAKREKRKAVILTCKENLIGFYEAMGFQNKGISNSLHGGAVWYDMELKL